MRTLSTMIVMAPAAVALRLTIRDNAKTPVARLRNALATMKTELEQNIEAKEKQNDKNECFCKDIAELKEKLSTADQDRTDAQAVIEEQTANVNTLTTEIAQLNKDITGLTGAIADLVKEDNNRTAEYQIAAKNYQATIDAVKSAITVLSKHHPDFMQVKSALSGIQHPKMAGVVAMLQQQPEYASQSGQIFGVLKQMQADFEEDIKAATQEENDAAATNAQEQQLKKDLKKSKEAELTSDKSAKATAQSLKSEAMDKKTNAESLFAQFGAKIQQDEKFCAENKAAYAKVVKGQQKELKALNDALRILNSDKMHSSNNKVQNQGKFFLQLGTKTTQNAFEAAQKLKMAGQMKLANIVLSQDAIGDEFFAGVIQDIRNLQDGIKSQKKDEAEELQNCLSKLREYNSTIQDLGQKIEQDDNNIENAKNSIAKLEADLASDRKERKEAQQSINVAGKDRKEQNNEYQTFFQETTDFMAIVKQVQTILQGQYGSALVQEPDNNQQLLNRGAESMEAHEDQDGSGVLALLSNILNDSETGMALQTANENQSQQEYEQFVQTQNSLINSLTSAIGKDMNTLGTKKQDKLNAEKSKDLHTKEKQEQTAGKAEQKALCKFVMDNGPARQTKLQNEWQALADAVAFLQGMSSK